MKKRQRIVELPVGNDRPNLPPYIRLRDDEMNLLASRAVGRINHHDLPQVGILFDDTGQYPEPEIVENYLMELQELAALSEKAALVALQLIANLQEQRDSLAKSMAEIRHIVETS